VRLCRHPDGQAVGVGWALTWEEPVCWANAAEGRIQLQVPDQAGVLQDIHPDGGEYLASPQWDDDTAAAGDPVELGRRNYPDGALVERLAISEMLPGARLEAARYLTGELLLVGMWSQSTHDSQQQQVDDLLVGQAPLRVLGRVGYPGDRVQPGAVVGGHDGTWLTLSDGMVERWTLAQAPK
jgi:hypothetical protein